AKFLFDFERGEPCVTAAYSRVIAANIDHDSIQPRREILIGAKPSNIFVHAQEDFLCGIASVLRVPQHSPRGGDDSPLMMFNDLLERGHVAALRALDYRRERRQRIW